MDNSCDGSIRVEKHAARKAKAVSGGVYAAGKAHILRISSVACWVSLCLRAQMGRSAPVFGNPRSTVDVVDCRFLPDSVLGRQLQQGCRHQCAQRPQSNRRLTETANTCLTKISPPNDPNQTGHRPYGPNKAQESTVNRGRATVANRILEPKSGAHRILFDIGLPGPLPDIQNLFRAAHSSARKFSPHFQDAGLHALRDHPKAANEGHLKTGQR